MKDCDESKNKINNLRKLFKTLLCQFLVRCNPKINAGRDNISF